MNTSAWKPLRRGLKAVVFDLDDTLYPEHAYVLSGFRQVANWAAEQLGTPAGDGYHHLATLFQEGVRGDTFNRWLAHFQIPEAPWLPKMIDAYRTHEPCINPFDEVPSLLARLRGVYRLGLVSDGYLEVQQRKLTALGLEPLFEAVVFSDALGREYWKPSTAPFEAVLAALNIEGPAAVYIADNPLKDFFGARQSGMKTIRFHGAHGIYREQEAPSPAHEADLSVESFAQLETLLLA